MKTLYIPINAKSPQEYHKRCLELEARGCEPHAPMRKITKELKSYDLHQDSQGRRFSKNKFTGSHDYHSYSGVYRKVEA